MTSTRAAFSRRVVLQSGLAGGLVLAFQWPLRAAPVNEPEQPPDHPDGQFAPNAFIRIDNAGKTTLVIPQAEMGQGVYTAIAMILAEELDADFAQVVIKHAPASDKLYANPLFGIQVTGNSNSIRSFWDKLREAGAAARAMLITAAAAQWQVDAASCSASNGNVTHAASNRTLTYGELADAATKLPVPEKPNLKDPKAFTLIGKPLKRHDTPDKSDGKTIYGIDAMVPDMKFATLAQCPVQGGKVKHVDDSVAKKVPGVRQVVVLDDLVAVVGDHMWAAWQGLDALKVTWDEGPNAKINSADVWNDLRAASKKDGVVAKSEGDVEKGLVQGERFDADYELPFLAHATMEPMNCTVRLTPGACEIWTGTQVQSRSQEYAAKAAGLPIDKVTVNNHYLGGGFGRRLEPDMVASAVRIAKEVPTPIKVVWTREEDMQHDVYRPVYRDTISASLSNGKIVAWKYKVTGSSVLARWLPPAFQNGIDGDAVDSAVDMPYDIPNKRVEYVRAEPPGVTTGFWRGVGPNNNVFAIESFIDELARKANMDPVAFRLGMLDGTPRLKAALKLVAEKSGWSSPLPTRVGRGVCAQPSFGSFIATVVEAEVDDVGGVHLRHVTCAVDTGIAVNPDTIVAQ
ncbi:MAG: molybdopterin cofactor-binding domain-containing protein, partial [Pseudolabrys sp.]